MANTSFDKEFMDHLEQQYRSYDVITLTIEYRFLRDDLRDFGSEMSKKAKLLKELKLEIVTSEMMRRGLPL